MYLSIVKILATQNKENTVRLIKCIEMHAHGQVRRPSWVSTVSGQWVSCIVYHLHYFHSRDSQTTPRRPKQSSSADEEGPLPNIAFLDTCQQFNEHGVELVVYSRRCSFLLLFAAASRCSLFTGVYGMTTNDSRSRHETVTAYTNCDCRRVEGRWCHSLL